MAAVGVAAYPVPLRRPLRLLLQPHAQLRIAQPPQALLPLRRRPQLGGGEIAEGGAPALIAELLREG